MPYLTEYPVDPGPATEGKSYLPVHAESPAVAAGTGGGPATDVVTAFLI